MEGDTVEPKGAPKIKAKDLIEQARRDGYRIIDIVNPKTGEVTQVIGMHKDHDPNNSLAKVPGRGRDTSGRGGDTYGEDPTLPSD